MGMFHTHFVLPFAEPERYAGLARRLRQIRKFERLSHGQQRAVQHQRLQKLLTHAYETAPFYRRQFDDAGVHPSQIGVGQPLPIPVTTRAVAGDLSPLKVSTAFPVGYLAGTSSSSPTRTPITPRDIEGLRDKVALNLHLNSWGGYHPGDSVMMLWSADRDLTDRPNWRWRLYEEVLMRRTSVASRILNDEILERFCLLYEKQRPNSPWRK